MDGATEEDAWREVVTRWEDEEAHRGYLASFADLEGLAAAGRRYRAVLEARPGDPVAARWRDEIVKRAMVQGLAQLPRTAAPLALPPWARRLLAAVVLGLLGLVAILAVVRLLGVFGARP